MKMNFSSDIFPTIYDIDEIGYLANKTHTDENLVA
jgi:hypothetical protein